MLALEALVRRSDRHSDRSLAVSISLVTPEWCVRVQ